MRVTPECYPELLAAKAERFRRSFTQAGIELPDLAIHASPPTSYRLRAEFRIWHTDERIDYAMFDPTDPRHAITLTDFPPAADTIRALMPMLKSSIEADATLSRRLFQVNFLSTLKRDMLVTLIYHRTLDAIWEDAARALASKLDIQIIGRSRGQKISLGRDWVEEDLFVDGQHLHYRQTEGAFSQPNGEVNRAMLSWTRAHATGLADDLLELYCGNGNFTVALAPLFRKVLATELSSASVAAARHNLATNGIENVALARMQSDEVSQALAHARPFRRLKDIDLDSYRFSTVFIDPPRAGLDAATLQLVQRFDNILYISCNPATLLDNISKLADGHRIKAAAVFDQFPYTDHLEAGILLTRA